MRKISFKIEDNSDVPKTSGYAGHYILVTFTLITKDGFMGSALKADLKDDGTGIFYLPEPEDIEGEILNVEFYGPGGYWVSERKTLAKTVFDTFATDDKMYAFSVELIRDDDKKVEKSFYTVRGRLVDIKNGARVSRRELMVFETRTEEVLANNYKIIHSMTTDLEGYFKFEMPYMEGKMFYHAYVPGSVEKILPFSVRAGIIDERQILGIELLAEADTVPVKEGEKDCACDNTPRLPGAEELARGEGVFSQDLGVGCVEFTKPNRVVEEHQFVQIVRTTDPQIRKVNIPTNTFQEILDNMELELNPADTTLFIMEPLPIMTFQPYVIAAATEGGLG